MYLELILLASRSTFGITEVAHERQLRSLFVPALVDGVRPADPPNLQLDTGPPTSERLATISD
jgi:hypothetical protein